MDIRPFILLGKAVPAESVMPNRQPTPCWRRDWDCCMVLSVCPVLLLEVPRIETNHIQVVGICSVPCTNRSGRLPARPLTVWLSYEGPQPSLLEPRSDSA